jgi:hypothetical protein
MTKTVTATLFACAVLALSPLALADDEDDVLAAIQRWADLEGDLEVQAGMIRDDRVMVSPAGRQASQAHNLRDQLAVHNARVKMAGGEPQYLISIHSPVIQVYGNTAVASFVRQFRVLPYNADPMPTTRAWFSMVLVKERGDWGIAHTHVSPINNN